MSTNLKPFCGFTQIELIMIIVILGILSVVAIPKFFDNSIFKARGFADQVLATLRYAQKSAIAQHQNVCVNLAATTVSLTIDASCATPLNLADRQSNSLTAPSGITLSPATTITFDALGRANTTATITITGVSTTITVEAQTGYVHQ